MRQWTVLLVAMATTTSAFSQPVPAQNADLKEVLAVLAAVKENASGADYCFGKSFRRGELSCRAAPNIAVVAVWV